MSDDYDVRLNSGELEGGSHGLLVAVLIALGGHVDLPLSAVEPDAMGDAEGRLYGVTIGPGPDGTVRLMVINHNSPDTGGDQHR